MNFPLVSDPSYLLWNNTFHADADNEDIVIAVGGVTAFIAASNNNVKLQRGARGTGQWSFKPNQ